MCDKSYFLRGGLTENLCETHISIHLNSYAWLPDGLCVFDDSSELRARNCDEEHNSDLLNAVEYYEQGENVISSAPFINKKIMCDKKFNHNFSNPKYPSKEN